MSNRPRIGSALMDQRTHRMEVRYDRNIGHLHVANLNARLVNRHGEAYFTTTNSLGFRSNEEFVEQKTARPKILVFGDSQTAGEDCDNSERYSDRLAELLDADVYNFGLSGTAPDQHLMIFENYARDIQADAIVWGITIHNIERIKMRFRPTRDRMSGKYVLMPKPYFTLEGNGELQLHHVPTPRASKEVESLNTTQFDDEQVAPSLVQRVYRAPIFRPLVSLMQRAGIAERLRAIVYRATGIQMYDDYLDANSDGWRLMRGIVQRFNSSCGGIPLIVVPLPSYHYIVDKISPIHDELFETLDDPDKGLHIHKITEQLVEKRSFSERKGLISSHYTAAGHDGIARLIAQKLEAMGVASKSRDQGEYRESKRVMPGRITIGIAILNSGAAAAIAVDGKLIAVGVEEAFTRKKADNSFPMLSVNFCLEGVYGHTGDVHSVVGTGLGLVEICESLNVGSDVVTISEVPDSQAPTAAVSLICEEVPDSFPGPAFSEEEILAFMDMYEVHFQRLETATRDNTVVDLLKNGLVVANFCGASEHGKFLDGGRGIFMAKSIADKRFVGDERVVDVDIQSFAATCDLLRVYREVAGESQLCYKRLQEGDEPPALTPFDAYRALMFTDTDVLALSNYLIYKEKQKPWPM